ncbi:MAG: beta-lactamase/transpeptidase-like protein [Benjaminiella poitrasii]|nr:MAG: beta-lactamase/transpeptidase-like protein [Benjaminiella poitrasii]
MFFMLGQYLGVFVALLSYITYKLTTKGPFQHSLCAITHDIVGPCLRSTRDVPIHGFVDPAFESTYHLFVDNFLKGREIGAGFTVYVDNKKVISLQGGWQDVEKGIEYTNETLQMVFSSTKALSAIVIAQVVDQGLLSYDEKISTYWPEFAQGNKENVTLRDLMRHTAGIGALDQPISYEDITNPATFTDILARQPHNFDGVSLHSYHAITQGWYQNEILKRVIGRTVDEYTRDILNKNYDIEWYLKPDALPNADQIVPRIAPFYEESLLQKLFPLIVTYVDPRQDKTFVRSMFDKNSLFSKTIMHANIDQRKGVMNNRDPKRRAIEGPSYTGHTNADSVAKLAAMMANGGRSISPNEPDLFQDETTYAKITHFDSVKWVNETDQILPQYPFYNQQGGFLRFPHDDFLKMDDPEADFEGGSGAGGSLFLYNRKYRIGLAYVMNGYRGFGIPDDRTIPLIKSVFEQVKKMKTQQ